MVLNLGLITPTGKIIISKILYSFLLYQNFSPTMDKYNLFQQTPKKDDSSAIGRIGAFNQLPPPSFNDSFTQTTSNQQAFTTGAFGSTASRPFGTDSGSGFKPASMWGNTSTTPAWSSSSRGSKVVPYSTSRIKDDTSTFAEMMDITGMKEYANKTVDEIRKEDYEMSFSQPKPSGIGFPGGFTVGNTSMFSNQPFNSSGFNSNTATGFNNNTATGFNSGFNSSNSGFNTTASGTSAFNNPTPGFNNPIPFSSASNTTQFSTAPNNLGLGITGLNKTPFQPTPFTSTQPLSNLTQTPSLFNQAPSQQSQFSTVPFNSTSSLFNTQNTSTAPQQSTLGLSSQPAAAKPFNLFSSTTPSPFTSLNTTQASQPPNLFSAKPLEGQPASGITSGAFNPFQTSNISTMQNQPPNLNPPSLSTVSNPFQALNQNNTLSSQFSANNTNPSMLSTPNILFQNPTQISTPKIDLTDPYLIKNVQFEKFEQQKPSIRTPLPSPLFRTKKDAPVINLKIRDPRPINRSIVYTIPDMKDIDTSHAVSSLVVGFEGKGRIEFLEPVTVKSLEDIEKRICIRDGNVETTDQIGTGLNKKARVYIEGLFPVCRATGEIIKGRIDNFPEKGIQERFIYQLKNDANKKFVDYNVDNGIYVYEVNHF